MAKKQRLLTGLQPSGQLHIGNYLGALKPFADTYGEYESFLMVADYHALTTIKYPEQLRENTIDVVADYIAAGVNPAQAVIFKQSDVPEHTELAWIFECLVTVPFLMQAHAYKDKVGKGLEANAGLFNYPMLMAADILMYDTDLVPVGEDQRQHVEYAREAAAKFNAAYGETFKEPKDKIIKSVGTVPGIDGRKMSKSYGNTIPLFGTDDAIRTAVMGIVTDSRKSGEPLDPEKDTVFGLHRLFSGAQIVDLEKRYLAGSIGYKESKELLAENIIASVTPMREKRAALSRKSILKILADGGEVAREHASKKIKIVREKIGVTFT
ncbi:MAG: tryptophan--tRNA ligase [Patescibacteria group bacterium]|nr:tryptophan--tRNA ligase [Patescibacteria group bacterium]